ncbi:DUF6479 family protein [Streptomyces sp. NPDC032198]|uniref:DUF6479 family protein n=1 Tax=Streptomyces sp. NPDC032198 TaxID=3155127 RepID=UPI0033C2E244
MQTHRQTVLALEGGGSLIFLIVGIAVVAGLLAMFISGRRRAARRTEPTAPSHRTPPSGEAQRGETWQTPDDDPEQGHPHP